MERKYTPKEQQLREHMMREFGIPQDYFGLSVEELRQLYEKRFPDTKIPNSRKGLIVRLMMEDIRPSIISMLEKADGVKGVIICPGVN